MLQPNPPWTVLTIRYLLKTLCLITKLIQGSRNFQYRVKCMNTRRFHCKKQKQAVLPKTSSRACLVKCSSFHKKITVTKTRRTKDNKSRRTRPLKKASFQAASPMVGVPPSGSYSNNGMAASSTADSLEPHQQQTESSALSSSNGLSQSNIHPPVASATTRTKTPEQQETVRSSSSLLQDQTPQRQENATDPTTATTTTTTTVTNEMSIAEPPTSLAIPAETPVVSQPTIVTATNTTKTVQAQAPPTKHKKSSFFSKLFKKKSRR